MWAIKLRFFILWIFVCNVGYGFDRFEIWEPKGEFITYERNTELTRRINGSKYYRLNKVHLEWSTDCDNDFLEFQGVVGDLFIYKLLGPICGTQELLQNTILNFNHQVVEVSLYSNAEHDGLGYGFSLEEVPTPPLFERCRHDFQSTSDGTIAFRSDMLSINRKSCKFMITPNGIGGIILKFTYLRICSCEHEKIVVYDVSQTPHVKLAEYCGQHTSAIPDPKSTGPVLSAQSNQISVEYLVMSGCAILPEKGSDGSIQVFGNHGFEASYESVPYTVLQPNLECPEPNSGYVLHKGFCYKKESSMQTSWQDAETKCRNEGN